MAIEQNGSGQIVYSEPENKRRSDATGTVVDDEFAIIDQTNVLKQVQFLINPTTTAPATLTLQCDIGADATINLTNAASSDSFTIMQPITGTSPTADSPNDTLTFSSGDSTIQIIGNSTTDTLDFRIGANVVEGPGSSTDYAIPAFNGTDGSVLRATTILTDSSNRLLPQAAAVERVVALSDAATIATNAAQGNIFTVTLGGNRTLGAPTNPTSGQKCIWRVTQDATGSRTLAFNAVFRFGADVTSPSLSTTANITDYIGAIYNAASSTWDVVAVARGY